MAKKLTRSQLSALRADYLAKRQELLQAQVDELGIILFDKIYEKYLSQLERSPENKLTLSGKNISLVRGMDVIYKSFRDNDNARVIKQFVTDTLGIVPLNEQYFKGIQGKPTAFAAKRAEEATLKSLGITKAGKPLRNGFVDKFIRDETLLKKLKSQTLQALHTKKGFLQFREELKVTIQGEAGKPLSGGLQQYYRNNAYDTMQKVDRLNSEEFADELGLRYFIWSGGELPTSRQLCIYAHGKIVDAEEFKNLKYNDLKKRFREGLPNGKKQPVWKPLIDLGGFGCIHRKDYVANEYALNNKHLWLNIKYLKS